MFALVFEEGRGWVLRDKSGIFIVATIWQAAAHPFVKAGLANGRNFGSLQKTYVSYGMQNLFNKH